MPKKPAKPAIDPAKLAAIDAAQRPGTLRQVDAFTHDEHSRANIPPVGLAGYDTAAEPEAKYAYDPHIDPSLQWAGKKEGASFTVPTSSIHVHEVINPSKIIRSVQTVGEDYQETQPELFESDVERMKRRSDAIAFYQHKDKWTNRLIAGDSLVIMNSLLEKEGMAGQVQMVYIDPPYGIKYGSNFQPFVNKRDVKDGKDEDLTAEPEMVKAFRDTWELGIHSYLTYLRDRLLLARELLVDSGSVFVQISDENVHHVREICDEVFGAENFVSLITFRKKLMPLGSKTLEQMADFLIWYCKDKASLKYRQLYKETIPDLKGRWTGIEENGKLRRFTKEERTNFLATATTKRIFGTVSQWAPSFSENNVFEFAFEGKKYFPPAGQCWVTSLEKMQLLAKSGRLFVEGDYPRYVMYHDDFPFAKITSPWDDTAPAQDKSYVVQTNENVIARCLLMTTDPGDLVLDITCGSGTTAYVAEQWGRRWITCDTSRIAITLAKKRLMTAVFPWYKIREWGKELRVTSKELRDSQLKTSNSQLPTHNSQQFSPCPSNGFIYKTVPHITLKSIANGEPAEQETLYDQPEVEKKKIRISGPFTVEALPAPVGAVEVRGLDSGELLVANELRVANCELLTTKNSQLTNNYQLTTNYTKKQQDWMEELRASGILGRNKKKIEFSRVEPLEGGTFLHAIAETAPQSIVKGNLIDDPTTLQQTQRAVICFAGENYPLDVRMVEHAMNEARYIQPKPELLIFAAFQFDPAAAEVIDSMNWPNLTLLKAQMNTDLMTGDLKKNRSSNQSFWLVGQPDVELIKIESANDANLREKETEKISDNSHNSRTMYKVRIRGFDYYDVTKGQIDSGGTNRVALWMLDTDYDGMCVEPRQVFFPMDGASGGWERLAKTLKAEIDQDLIEKYRGVESLPFAVKDNTSIAVKIVDDRGIESLKVMSVGRTE